MKRFQDWRFRTKLLVVGLVPVALVGILEIAAFSLGLESVWRDAVRRQTTLLQLDSLVREYQAEVREFVISGSPSTLEEITEIEEELAEAFEVLESEGAHYVSLAGELRVSVDQMISEARALKSKSTQLVSPADADGELEDGGIEDEMEAFEGAEQGLEGRIDQELAVADRLLADAFRRFRLWMFGGAMAGLVVGWLLAAALARWLDGPLAVLRQAGERILDGDYRAGKLLDSHDELGRLAESFDHAAEEIRHLLADKERNVEMLKNNQAQLVQAGKLAAVGELAAGVAHELNNPLSAVLTYGVLLREKAQKAPPEAIASIPKLIERLEIIEKAAQRCKRIADNLLTFARQGESERGPVHLAELIDESVHLTRIVWRRKKVVIDRAVEADLLPVWADRGQILQVLINLVGNAAAAVDDGGRVEIGCRNDGDMRAIWVKDDGPGIDPEVADRIFDPFVTTKPVGEGTGLGLSIVFGIVQSHGGRIEVDSSDGGATFRVFLPGNRDSSNEESV